MPLHAAPASPTATPSASSTLPLLTATDVQALFGVDRSTAWLFVAIPLVAFVEEVLWRGVVVEWLRARLPGPEQVNASLYIPWAFQSFQIYIDGQLTYEFGNLRKLASPSAGDRKGERHLVGSKAHFIPLGDHAGGNVHRAGRVHKRPIAQLTLVVIAHRP